MLLPLQDEARLIAGDAWPEMALLQQLLVRAGTQTASGTPLRLVQSEHAGNVPYEIRLYKQGELEFRQYNWHDLFNVLMWLRFPRAKAALNARHYAAFSTVNAVGGRGAVRDALTLFDEDGIIVLATNPGLLQMIRDFQWKPLFWQSRSDVLTNMRFLPFGHALCEKALAPYQGMTGRGLLLEVDSAVLELALPEQVAQIDRMVAQQIAAPGNLQTTRDLAPVPVLGVPGWCAGNEQAAYYDDQNYFRPGRSLRRSSQRPADTPGMKGQA